MAQTNDTLPQNLTHLIANLTTRQAVPLGTMQDIPFLALKIPASSEALLTDGDIFCEMKPSIFNIDHGSETLAICIVQIKLNGLDAYTYSAAYDLTNDKHYSDCHALLNMRKYGLFIASENLHDFLVFDTPFDAFFDPRDVLAEARENATETNAEAFGAAVNALFGLKEDETALWHHLNEIVPFDNRWYLRTRMEFKKQ
jgi:hypothetical protein